LILLENQVPAVPVLRTYMKPQNHYVEIDLSGAAAVTITDSRAFLARLGIHGEIIATPGHSDDSITLVLDEGAAFVGDLTHPLAVAGDATLLRSWEKVRSLGVKTIYPGHGPVWHLD
ncbi:MAG TPA: hypothetical protein VMT34_11230, partial [Aggregatilineales bacterium]|nr:hypothetical protein [Aggregatilineales bacterium]